MIIQRKLAPGRPGTKKLFQKYGERLICVRYRYDTKKKEKMKTVELLVEKNTWDGNGKRIPGNKRIRIRIAYDEIKMRSLVKAAGGRWNNREKMWELPYRDVLALGLEGRIAKTEKG